jgi:hypothetical protein
MNTSKGSILGQFAAAQAASLRKVSDAKLGVDCQVNSLPVSLDVPALRCDLQASHIPGPSVRAKLTPTHQSLKLLLSKAHVPFGHLIVSVQRGLEDE